MAAQALAANELTIKQLVDYLWDARRSSNSLVEGIGKELDRKDPDFRKFDGYISQMHERYDFFDELKRMIPTHWFASPTIHERFRDRIGAMFYDMGQLKKYKIHSVEMLQEFLTDLRKIDSDCYTAILIADKIKEPVLAPVPDQEPGKPKPGPRKSWKEQVNDFAVKMLQDEEEAAKKVIDEDTISNQLIKSLAAQKPRLLKVDEPFGIVTAPVICSKSFITKFGWALLQKPPMKLRMEYVHQSYLLIKNAWLLGFDERLVNDMHMGIDELPSVIHRKIVELGNRDIKDMTMVGPVQKRGPHYYLVLMPGQLMSRGDVNIYGWDFNPGVMTDAPKSEIDMVTDEEIAKELPGLKQYLPEN